MARPKKVQTIRQTGSVELDCIFCKSPCRTNADVKSVLCDRCVAKLSDAPEPPKTIVTKEAREARKAEKAAAKAAKPVVVKATAGRGRGWHLKKVIQFDGVWYSFGKQITEKEAKKLA